MADKPICGLFVGLTTLDFIYHAASPPKANQKLVASDYLVSAGGPATNAAIAFRHLGGRAKLLSVIGSHAITHLIRADLQAHRVESWDLAPQQVAPPPVSSIIVTEATGDRAVISINASKTQAAIGAIPPDCLAGVDVVLIDGHQMAVGQAIAQQARALSIPVVVDGGSWKPNFRDVLGLTDYAICSANFYPPGCKTKMAVVAYLKGLGIHHIAITYGGNPIYYRTPEKMGWLQVPQIQPVDTLGAGDIFHGAFCYFGLQQNFVDALASAATIAAHACEFFGPRGWMQSPEQEGGKR